MKSTVLYTSCLTLILSCRNEAEKVVNTDPIDTATDRIDADGDGYFNDEDCDDADAASNPGAVEVCDGLDNNCDGEVDEGVLTEFYLDSDGDGFGDETEWIEACDALESYVPNGNDCDDDDELSYPSAPERCDDQDNDCDGDIDEDVLLEWYLDEDGDGAGSEYLIEACNPPEGYVDSNNDCDDENSDAYPDAEEICDEVDNDCDGDIDEELMILVFVDQDEDGFGDESSLVEICEVEVGYSLTGGDCDDIDSSINPNADEVCEDGVDNNCDGFVDEATAIDAVEWYLDQDSDGFGDSTSSQVACDPPVNHVGNTDDCDDSDDSIYPSAPELCDGIVNACGTTLSSDETDDDGDGYVECIIDSNGWDGSSINGGEDCDDTDPLLFPAQQWYADLDGDGFGDPTVAITACIQPSNTSLDNTDCDDTNANHFPGQTWYVDSDGDGFGNPSNTVTSCLMPNNSTLDNTDCNDSDATHFPGQIWYTDSDGDGFGDVGSSTASCSPPSNGTLDSTDCNDGDNTAFPSAPELCDGIVNACGTTLSSDETDDDGDGYVECIIDSNGWDGSSINGGEDCDDGTNTTFPGAPEGIGDEIDSDCDGGEICVLDADDDGHGNENGLTQVSVDTDCSDALEAIASSTDDCDDSNALYNPTLGCSGTDCEDVLSNGWSTGDGVYSIDPDGPGGNSPYDVYCDMTTDGGGWMRITHLHSNRDIASIKRNAPFFTAAWQQNNTSFSNTSNANLVLDNSTYGMLQSSDLLQSATNIRLTCNDTTRNLSARAIWNPSSSQLNQWLTETSDQNEYQSSPYTVSLSKNGSGFSNANVYFSHTENAFFGSWHVCGRLTATTGGFQLGFCNNGPGTEDTGVSNANQIMLGYHTGFSGLRLECTADSPKPTTIVNGSLSVWVR